MNIKKLSDVEHQQAEEAMRVSLVDEPQVGIFWYTPELGVFGDESYPASLIRKQGAMTFPKSHDQVWAKNCKRARAKKDKNSPFYYIKNSYKYPRGRIFIKEDKLVVMVGKWIEDYPQAKDEIIDVFNLPPDVEFKYDPHWDVEHGWAGDYMLDLLSCDDI